MTPNIFSAIAVNDDDFKITPREKFLKKAAKKLNEIERLKEKGKYHSLTAEECTKLGQEDFWNACLYEEPEKSSMKEERKLKKEEEKRKKKEEERRVYEEYKKKMEENERKRREEEQKEKIRKEEEQKRKVEQERKRKNQEKKAKKNGKHLEEEYRDLLLLHHGNNDKTFRLLSLKYHPDKNVGRTIWANEMQKRLGECREKYSSF